MSTDKPKKYIVVDHATGIKYEVTEHTDELGYIHKQSEPEVKPVSFEQIKKLYDKEFPSSTRTSKPVNEIKKLKQLIDNAWLKYIRSRMLPITHLLRNQKGR